MASLTNKHRRALSLARSRHGRHKSGLILCEGQRCCTEALSRRPAWLALPVCSSTFARSAAFAELDAACRAQGVPPVVVPDREFAALAVTQHPQGVLLLMERPGAGGAVPAPTSPFIVVLDRLGEPGNLGTILRTAWAVGLHDVWLTRGTADPFAPKAIRAGMGAQFALDLTTVADLVEARDGLRASGYETLWLSVPRGGVSCFDPAFELDRCGLVIGNEASGVQACPEARPVSIPMPGAAESLNVAQAATVLLFEAVRRGVL